MLARGLYSRIRNCHQISDGCSCKASLASMVIAELDACFAFCTYDGLFVKMLIVLADEFVWQLAKLEIGFEWMYYTF